jgi:hypothetical protein
VVDEKHCVTFSVFFSVLREYMLVNPEYLATTPSILKTSKPINLVVSLFLYLVIKLDRFEVNAEGKVTVDFGVHQSGNFLDSHFSVE